MCFSDPSGKNFRKLIVDKTYKDNRRKSRKPLGYHEFVEWVMETYRHRWLPSLEGDDVIGILCTAGKIKDPVIWSGDKDLLQIPGLHLTELNNVAAIDPAGALDFFMYQVLAGDMTDGYPGCPGMGDVKSLNIVFKQLKAVPYIHEFSRGPRKGQTETRYTEEHCDDLWEIVVSRYVAAGLGERDALKTARLAKILHASDFNKQTKEVILWTPTK